MSKSDDIDDILAKISEYTTTMVAIAAPDYQTALAINSAVSVATQLSRDLLHLKMVTSIEDVRRAALSLKAQTKTLQDQTKTIKAIVGKAAGIAKAASIVVQIGLGVDAL